MNEVKEKCVLITERNFYNLIKHFFGSSDKFDEEIKKELTEKLDKMVVRQYFSLLLTASTEEEREKNRILYLDSVGIHEDFRW